MRVWITPQTLYLDRREWDNSGEPRLGIHVDPFKRQTFDIHHSVAVDNDATPDLWTNESEVIMQMRRLRVIRPDLGADVPYNFVAFAMEDGKLIICEGRGALRRGAHNRGRNTPNIGLAVEGDTETPPNPNLGPYVPSFNAFFGWAKGRWSLVNLEGFHPHQEYLSTACPGVATMDVIEDFEYGGELDMATAAELQKQIDGLQHRQGILITSAGIKNDQIKFAQKILVNHEKRIADLEGKPPSEGTIPQKFIDALESHEKRLRAISEGAAG